MKKNNIRRTHNLDIVNAATKEYQPGMIGFIPDFWLAIPANVALTNDRGDVALFERVADQDNTVFGHYFFFSREEE